NSQGAWEDLREPELKPVGDVFVPEKGSEANDRTSDPLSDPLRSTSQAPRLVPALSVPAALDKIGVGTLCVLKTGDGANIYGRSVTVADRLNNDRVILAKWIRRLTNWNGRQAPLALWNEKIVPLIEKKLAAQKTPVVNFANQQQRIVAQVSIAELPIRVSV